MTCNGHTSMHDALEPSLYFFNGRTGRQTTWLCRGCATVIEAMGSGWTRDRRSDPARADRLYAYERLPAALSDRTPRRDQDATAYPPELSPGLGRAPTPVPPGLRVRSGGLGALIHKPSAT